MRIEPLHIFDAYCSLAILGLSHHRSHAEEFFTNNYLGIDYKKLSQFTRQFYEDFHNLVSDTTYLTDKNDAFSGYDNFYQWYESFGVINACTCRTCKQEKARIENTYDEFYELRELHNTSAVELPLSAYTIINAACINLGKVSQFDFDSIQSPSSKEPIPYNIVQAALCSRGRGCEESNVLLTLEMSYEPFYQRNIMNHSLSLLGDDYPKLKQQIWGVAAE